MVWGAFLEESAGNLLRTKHNKDGRGVPGMASGDEASEQGPQENPTEPGGTEGHPGCNQA